VSVSATHTIESPHRLVRASAGSGKTFQLTNTLLRLLLAGEDPSELLATTFTRAAAGEILHRTLSRLSAAALEKKALEELQRHVDADLTHDACAAALERVVGSLHRLSVLTIDAFFSRLSSSFSLELGLAPGWRMLDEEEDARLRALAVDRALRSADEAATIELLRDLQGDEIRTHAHQAVMHVVDRAYAAYLETRGDEAVWSAVQPVGARLGEDAIAAAIEAVATLHPPLTKSGTPDKRWRKALDKAARQAREGDWASLVSGGLAAKILAGELEYYKAEMPDEYPGAFAPLIEHARCELTADHARRTLAMFRLLEQFDAAYRVMKRDAGGLTFDDPPRLLHETATTGDLEHLYFRLDAHLRHVLLDEFQDTSMSQFRLIEPILDEMLSQAEGGRSVFCVGDAKQSLYAWREAEPTLLPALARRWPTLLEEPLAESWRSSPAVLEAVNAMFSHVAANPAMQADRGALAAAEAWDERFDRHAAAAQKRSLTGAARLIVGDEPSSDEPDADDIRRATLNAAAQRVDALRARAPGASIAVLVRRGADLRIVLAMLRKKGVDATEQRGNPLVDTPSVAAAASMLRLIDHPGHTAAKFHVARTPLGPVVGLDRDTPDAQVRRIASRLRRRMGERGCAPVLAEWHEATIGSMDARGSARFEQLLDLADAFDASGAGGPADLAEILETRRIDEPGRSPVRVMTIHGSKGLEFDAVVLPLVSSQTWQVSSGGALMARDEPLGAVTRVTRYPSALLRALHEDLDDIHAAAMQRQVNEELCCLYVAATRAKRCLEMVVPADKAGRDGETPEWTLRPDHVARCALAPEAPATPNATLWQTVIGDDWATDEAFHEAPRVETPAPTVALSVRAPAARPGSRLAGATPSRERAGGAVDAGSLLARRDPRGRVVGDLVHRWFERIQWIEDGAPDEATLREEAASEGVEAGTIDRAIAAFSSGVAGAGVREALSRDAWRARHPQAEEIRVWNERPFAVRDADRLLEGRFDRLVVGRAGGRPVCAEVLDFKTDHNARDLDEDALATYAETHRAQMAAYRRAAAGLLGLEPERVETTLVFTAAGARVRLA